MDKPLSFESNIDGKMKAPPRSRRNLNSSSINYPHSAKNAFYPDSAPYSASSASPSKNYKITSQPVMMPMEYLQTEEPKLPRTMTPATTNSTVKTHLAITLITKLTDFMSNFGQTLSQRKITIFIGTGIIFIFLAILSYFTSPSIVINRIHKRLILKEGSDTYENWKQVPVPLYNRFYFFNVLNANEIERTGAKPELSEIGPFTYRVLLRKHDIHHNPENGTVTYKERRTWIFIRNQSVADESTLISTLNTPLAMTLSWLQKASPAVRLVVGVGLDTTSQGFFIKRSVKQLLFEGYPDILTTFGPLLRPELPSAYNGRFGFFYPKNNSDDGIYRVHTGEDSINMLNIMDSHNGLTKLKYWSSDECNSLVGSTKSEVRPPLSSSTKELRMFNAELCRVIRLVRSSSYRSNQGIQVERFVLDPNFYANAVDYPPNACYTVKRPQRTPSILTLRTSSVLNQTPLPSGVMDLGPCKYGAPIFLSNPHFLDADPIYRSLVNGLKPNRSKHGFWLDVEPSTGSTVGVAARIQLNVAISTGQSSIRFRNIPEIIFPILWSEYSSQLTPRLAEKLRLVQWIPDAVAVIALALFSTFALIMFTIALAIHTFRVVKDKAQEKTKSGQSAPQSKLEQPSAPSILTSSSSANLFIMNNVKPNNNTRNNKNLSLTTSGRPLPVLPTTDNSSN